MGKISREDRDKPEPSETARYPLQEQVMIQSVLHGDMQRPAETTGPLGQKVRGVTEKTWRWVTEITSALIGIASANNGLFLRSVAHGGTPNFNVTIHWLE